MVTGVLDIDDSQGAYNCILTPPVLQNWLEWAGARLIAMPGARIKPKEPKVIWPEYDQEKFEILSFRAAIPIRAGAPSSTEIPIVDEILLLPNVCDDIYKRRILHARSLVHPISRRYLYNWKRISELLHTSPSIVKSLHVKGLKEACMKADPEHVCRIASFFNVNH